VDLACDRLNFRSPELAGVGNLTRVKILGLVKQPLMTVGLLLTLDEGALQTASQ
jgi:hypothetical protein